MNINGWILTNLKEDYYNINYLYGFVDFLTTLRYVNIKV